MQNVHDSSGELLKESNHFGKQCWHRKGEEYSRKEIARVNAENVVNKFESIWVSPSPT